MSTLHRGHIFHLTGRPRLTEAADALVEIPDGGLLIDADGRIEWCGPFHERPQKSGAPMEIIDHSGFLLPGFIDTHVHYPQVNSVDAYGGGSLLAWLDNCIFPAEARFADPAFARGAAAEFCHRLIRAGTTTAMVFGSAFPVAQRALFSEFQRTGLRGVIGRGIQTLGPEAARPLLTSEEAAIDLTREEIETWHPANAEAADASLLAVAIVPRFSLSVTRQTLRALGELYLEHRDRGVYFTSHLSETQPEIEEVQRQYGVSSYLDTYDGRFLEGGAQGGESLLGRRSVLAHCVHCSEAELARLAETGSSVAHCPNSQLFLGAGTMPWHKTVASGVNIALGSDFAAGDSWFMPDALNAAFKVHISEAGENRAALHPAELLYLATVGGARALDLEDRIGNFDPGREADMVVLDPSRWEPLANSLEWGLRSDDAERQSHARLFTLLMAANPVTVSETYVRGRRLTP